MAFENAAMDSVANAPGFGGMSPPLPQIGQQGPNILHTKKIRKGHTKKRKVNRAQR
jgi:hypothetical protein